MSYTNNYLTDSVDVTYKDTPIGGKLVMAQKIVTGLEMAQMNESNLKTWIKENLAMNLVRSMIDNNLIEFTKMTSSQDYSVKFSARCYLAPSEEVRILRTAL
jgi:DNA-directed RNA polymerase specialized sigma54-like protein